MAISDKKLYDGAALVTIVDARGFLDLTKLKEIEGEKVRGRCYVINHKVNIYIKHATAVRTAKKSVNWQFTFDQDQIEEIERLSQARPNHTFVIFVCNKVGICALSYDDFKKVAGGGTTVRGITVFRKPKNGQFQVRGPGGDLEHHIPLRDFPDCLPLMR